MQGLIPSKGHHILQNLGKVYPTHAEPFLDFKQQPQAAKVSTDLVFETLTI